MSTKLSENFTREEFTCSCGCGFDTVDAELITALETIREAFGGCRIIITSGCRCERHNAGINGSKNSQHTKGKAADFIVDGVDSHFVADCAEDLFKNKYGIGRYGTWTHIDVRPTETRWER